MNLMMVNANMHTKEFFKVTDLESVFKLAALFPVMAIEEADIARVTGRILAEDIVSDINLPDFPRATMDGYAVQGASTFGASEGNPAYLSVVGSVAMGEDPSFSIGPGEVAKIATGGMLPKGADSVVMIEHTNMLDPTSVEIYRSVAPGQNAIAIGEDLKKDEVLVAKGQRIRASETGLLAALGRRRIRVYQKPTVGIISTGDEIVPFEEVPGPGQIRDINSHTLSAMVVESGADPIQYGIVRDQSELLEKTCQKAVSECDMVLISGGSSVGMRDLTIEVLAAMQDAEILVHGIPISPGKPTILAKVQHRAFWGLPGHVVSAMVVFHRVVQPFISHISGRAHKKPAELCIPAKLSRNVPSAQGRVDYIRVRLTRQEGEWWAEPILGKSALIHTMVQADGLIQIEINTEGLERGTTVEVIPL
jgi:molybdopterin molybdotransferase